MAHHEPTHHPNNTPTPPHRPLSKPDINTEPESRQLADYIRRIVDTAPRPNPEQLTRLAGLLRNTDHEPDAPS